ncbi:MAG: RNA 2',3'-cyclic phosphodiesterase [Acidobacteria bacterium]|nr:RNA 2',3'-cyclic phosphodiesterase [Acidobacteriota bacterium]
MRLFVAYKLAEPPSVRLAALVAALRPRLPKAAWVAAHSYHLTFAFLGEQKVDVVPMLTDALARAASSVHAVDTQFGRGGFFPNERRPRVAWIAIAPNESIEAIAVSFREAVSSCGVSFDTKPFKAHLTLARIRDAWRPEDGDAFLRAAAAMEGVPFALDRVSLFESRLLQSGAVHEELAGFSLRGT